MNKLYMLIMFCALLSAPSYARALVAVQGSITADTTWSEDVLLKGPVFIRSGATVTISPGVIVYGEKSSVAALIIDRGGKLNAVGTTDKPIVFTTDQTSPKRGDWGGIIINGYSTLNVEGGIKEGEGDTGQFGCTGSECNEADSSGTLRYVRVEYGGIQFTPDNELNGIAFQGTGSGTAVDHVQVSNSKDDCIEFFGGTTSIKYAIMSACGDDSLDWTDGWRGNGQFLVVQQKGDEADNGIEADNLDKANDNLPRSNPLIYNMTMIGDPSTTYGEESTHGLTLRRGTAATLKNFIVMGFKKTGVRLNNEATFNQAEAGTLVFDNSIFYGSGSNFDTAACDKGSDGACTYTYPYTAQSFMTAKMQNNREIDPVLGNPYDLAAPDFRPAAGSPALAGAAAVPSGGFFETVDFIGAVDPENDWTRQPWTTYGIADWTEKKCTDADDDGYFAEGGDCGSKDCDDSDASINPGAKEACDDGVDNDCNGQVDDGCSVIPDNPCAAETLLGSDNQNLDIFRQYRDNVLAQSATGALYTQMYYRFTGEARAIIMADAELRTEAADVLERLIPVAAASLAGKNMSLDKKLAADLLSLLDRISDKAGLGLKIGIFMAQRDISKSNLPF